MTLELLPCEWHDKSGSCRGRMWFINGGVNDGLYVCDNHKGLAE